MINSFLSQFNAIYHKFEFLPSNILVFLFKIYTNSFYGIKMWFEERIKQGDLKKFFILYHKAIKRLAGMHARESQSNHALCEKIDVNIH